MEAAYTGLFHSKGCHGIQNRIFCSPPVQFDIPRPIKFSMQETANVDAHITKFLEKGIIVESSHEDGEFISNIFLQPKKDGSYRMILNLKDLNTFVTFHPL